MATNIGSKLKAWLRFNKSPVDDCTGNSWETFGKPTIGTANAIEGNALQLDGQSYIKLSGLTLGGQDFYIDGWVNVDVSSPDNARVLTLYSKSSGYMLFSLRKSSTSSQYLEVWRNGYADVSVDNGSSFRAYEKSIGVRVHFKLIWRYDKQLFNLCINDKPGSWLQTSAYTRQEFDVYIGALSKGTQGVIGSIDELRIYDGTFFSYGNNAPPNASEYERVYWLCDTIRHVRNPLIEFRYENYGTADLLTIAGTTVENLPATQSKTGSAFYQPTRAKRDLDQV